MKFLFVFFPLALHFINICEAQLCSTLDNNFGAISDSAYYNYHKKCWKIEVPANKYIRIDFKQLSLSGYSGCSDIFLEIATDTNDTYKFCYSDSSYPKPITFLSDVTITFSHYYYSGSSSFSLSYHIEDIICAQNGNFRCSKYQCIPESKVCDRVKDCANGTDEAGCEAEILSVKGLDESRENAISWLFDDQQSIGWGKNTHRAIVALSLAQGAYFQGNDVTEELLVKQLELQTSVALLRNSTNPISVSELSMYVNALSLTCHRPRHFYGYDLLKILGERASSASPPSPRAYLTLCNSNWTLSESDVQSLVELLSKQSDYPFSSDVQALTVMALTCIKNQQGKQFTSVQNSSTIYNSTVEKFINGQLSDGSFGNVYTTALVTQALIASGQETNPKWNVTSTVEYLMEQLDSPSVDFLSVYYTLPIFNARSLVDMVPVDCSTISRKLDEDEISDITDKLGEKVSVQYSLYVGDEKDVIHTIYLRLPEESTAYDIMRVAQVVDPKYKFRYGYVSGHMYIYEIAGIINDPEAGKFWLMYSEDGNRTFEHYTDSPDKFIVGDKEHLIMWYKTTNI